MGSSDTSDVNESECTIYMQITNLAASALAATVCFVISQLLQQATLLPIFALYFFEIFPESDLSRKIISIFDALGAEKDAITEVVRGAFSDDKETPDGPDAAEHDLELDEEVPSEGNDSTEQDVVADASKKNVQPATRRMDTCDLPLGAHTPAPRLLNRAATRRTLFKMEKTITEFKIPLGRLLSLDFHGYVMLASAIFCSTSMVTVAFILWDSETINHWYDGGFDESLSAYNVFLALCIIFGFSTMLIFVKILNEVYTLDNLQHYGFTLESKSKATADALFWVSTVTFTIALCIKWVYIVICLYVLAVLLLEVLIILLFAGMRTLFFNPIWTKVAAPVLRVWVPWLFVDKKSHRIHSPAYFLVFIIVYLMNCVTQMSRKTIKILVDKLSLCINVCFLMYSIVLFTFIVTVGKRDPEIVEICVSTSTIVVVSGYLGSVLLLLARPLLYLIYGESMMAQFTASAADDAQDNGPRVRWGSGRDARRGSKQQHDVSLTDGDAPSAAASQSAHVSDSGIRNHSLSMSSNISSGTLDRPNIISQGSWYSIGGSTKEALGGRRDDNELGSGGGIAAAAARSPPRSLGEEAKEASYTAVLPNEEVVHVQGESSHSST